MLIKISGTPLENMESVVAYSTQQFTEMAFHPTVITLDVANLHIQSADLNPLNVPQHLFEGLVSMGKLIVEWF